MRTSLCWLLALAACGGHAQTAPLPAALTLPESTAVLDAATGVPVSTAELLRRVRAADYVLLGELHDNPYHHRARAALLTAAGTHPAVVFEQFPETTAPIPPPEAGQDQEAWLDVHGFDRKGWKWPLHQPLIEAALASGRAIWGSGISRDAVRVVFRQGMDAAPEGLRRLIIDAPLDEAGLSAMERELIEGHCGKLPPEMLPGMRAAQSVRDASMAQALLAGGTTGPAWLIAGNGHVRIDMGVPRMLHREAPTRTVLVMGSVERGTDEAVPGPATGRRYDLILVTPPADRPDPCAGM
jgi:uncharacterized iron-regulated protein